MKTVDILISNFNSFEALQLCIESVRKFTKYPYNRILVYDDASTNVVDKQYLLECYFRKEIHLVLGPKRINHGAALNELLKKCKTDYAMILDNDIQIIEEGWLKDMVDFMEDDFLIVCGVESDYRSMQPSLSDWMQTWFMMINMKAYRDSMEIDWRRTHENGIMLPVGAKLWKKAQEDNPKGYKFVSNIPMPIRMKFFHHAHVSCIATEDPSDTPEFIKAREEKMNQIRYQLNTLRGQQNAL